MLAGYERVKCQKGRVDGGGSGNGSRIGSCLGNPGQQEGSKEGGGAGKNGWKVGQSGQHRLNYQEVIHMAVHVTITTHDGKVYTDPSKIKIPRNEHTEAFYRFLENYKPKKKPESEKAEG